MAVLACPRMAVQIGRVLKLKEIMQDANGGQKIIYFKEIHCIRTGFSWRPAWIADHRRRIED